MIDRRSPGSFPKPTAVQQEARGSLTQLHETSPIFRTELINHLALYMPWDAIFDIVALDRLYQMVLSVPGVILELGSRWGRHLAIFAALREIYEPYNVHRSVIGFDTFDGFPSVGAEDGASPLARPGSFPTPAGYEDHLAAVMEAHEQHAAVSNVRRFEIERGDVTETLPRYLEAHPETVVSLAYFDLDLYAPTRRCLELIRDHVVPGSVLAFDELAHREWPGETLAVKEVFGLAGTRVQKLSRWPSPAFIVVRS